jgi:hypothetical protein
MRRSRYRTLAVENPLKSMRKKNKNTPTSLDAPAHGGRPLQVIFITVEVHTKKLQISATHHCIG